MFRTSPNSLLPPVNPNTALFPCSSTKTSVSRGDNTHIPTYHGSLNATKATHLHVRHNNLSPNNLLMSYRDNNGNLKVMTKSYFLSLCNDISSREGYPHFTGHSFCIGGMTLLLQDSVDPEYVKMYGRWKSSTFTRYWRDLHTCASVHIDRVYTCKHLHQRLSA
ncbi:hypothetical protein D9758_015372 [Tetrapyrgos nigripes]|uniref:Tyr recombinase domain-containing protein n=1 Tax=Tetrapyrgos nigripes TaxID=182062 RepID=A0A8H5CAG0_9AGAR|nr:hypothetical protein D9758_015372 [Tetrapyrgos nigripes]